MKISTQFGKLTKTFGMEGSIRILANAGFEAMDLSVTGNMIPWEEGFFTDVNAPEFTEHFENIAKIAEKYGVRIGMTHAPYCMTWWDDPEAYALVQQQTIRAIRATGIMKCPYIVAHPVLHSDFNNGQNKERALQTNLDYFGVLAPFLKENNVVMCIENLYFGERPNPKIPNSCTSAEQMVELIDKLNQMHGNCFAACLDSGHATISGQDPIHMLKVLRDRLRVLHIHDNYGTIDNHVLPGYGVIDWKLFMKTLGEIGYQGDFNFEADQHWYNVCQSLYNEEIVTHGAKYKYLIGRMLIDLM